MTDLLNVINMYAFLTVYNLIIYFTFLKPVYLFVNLFNVKSILSLYGPWTVL